MAVWVWGTLAMLKQQQPLKNNTEWCWDGARSTYCRRHEQQQRVLQDGGLCANRLRFQSIFLIRAILN